MTKTNEIYDDLERVKIEFEKPVMISGVKVSYLIMREPILKDRISVQRIVQHEAELTVHLVSTLCEVPYEDLMAMRSRDWNRLETQLGLFLNGPS